MNAPRRLTIEQWDERYQKLKTAGLDEPDYGGLLSRHLEDGDYRLKHLLYDDSAEALRLWNFLLTEEGRLAKAKSDGRKLVGAMKDLGTVPVMAYSLPGITAFYPDGAWWIPCIMELSAGLLEIADQMGIDESFCPVRAMLGAFVTEAHYPVPDLLICSTGATCDDFSAIAQRLQGLGHPVLWWEAVHRRKPDAGEPCVVLPGGFAAPQSQADFTLSELTRVKEALENLAGMPLTNEMLQKGIQSANAVRDVLNKLRCLCFTADLQPLPALELLVAEMLAIHFCSDREESLRVLSGLLALVKKRIKTGTGHGKKDDARIYWINPVADLTVMNLLEACGGRICGTEYMFSHALDRIPSDLAPMEALARAALADPMTGSAEERAERVISDVRRFGSEGVVISKIPGASHCALEGRVIQSLVAERLDLPVIEIEVPPLSNAVRPSLKTRISALAETIKLRRR